MTDPSPGELQRRLEDLNRSLERQLAETRASVAACQSRSVSNELYVSERTALQERIIDTRSDIAELKKDVERVSDRITLNFRLALTGLIFPIVILIAGYLLTRAG